VQGNRPHQGQPFQAVFVTESRKELRRQGSPYLECSVSVKFTLGRSWEGFSGGGRFYKGL